MVSVVVPYTLKELMFARVPNKVEIFKCAGKCFSCTSQWSPRLWDHKAHNASFCSNSLRAEIIGVSVTGNNVSKATINTLVLQEHGYL